MVNIDEQIKKKLNEQLEKIKGDLIIFNTIQELTDKIQQLEDEIEKLKNKKSVTTVVSVCRATFVHLVYFNDN